MTSDQYQHLLHDLAHVAGMTDPSGLVEHGRVKVGELDTVLEHEPAYDADLLQVRMRLGTLPSEGQDLSRAILEANYVSGYGGECVFSLYPASDDVIITMRVRLQESMTAQELWQGISDVARHGGQMWQGIVAVAQTAAGSTPSDAYAAPGLRA
ncbi:MAG: CesT family type III secretion system chaperone [Bdellovibrionales bacterium]|nr:CesT family type III secretion system chaperone [Ramlibacter sp.]